jgi:hypothetical protein
LKQALATGRLSLSLKTTFLKLPKLQQASSSTAVKITDSPSVTSLMEYFVSQSKLQQTEISIYSFALFIGKST